MRNLFLTAALLTVFCLTSCKKEPALLPGHDHKEHEDTYDGYICTFGVHTYIFDKKNNEKQLKMPDKQSNLDDQ